MKDVGEPDEGEPHVRFDRRELEKERATDADHGQVARKDGTSSLAPPTARHLASSLPHQSRRSRRFGMTAFRRDGLVLESTSTLRLAIGSTSKPHW